MNNELKKMIDNFWKLSISEKKDKLLDLLDFVSEKISFVDWVKKYVMKSNESVTGEFIEKMYFVIMKIWYSTEMEVSEIIENKYKQKMNSIEEKMYDDIKKNSANADNLLLNL